MSAEETSAEETSAEEMPVAETSAEEMPVAEMPEEETPVEAEKPNSTRNPLLMQSSARFPKNKNFRLIKHSPCRS